MELHMRLPDTGVSNGSSSVTSDAADEPRQLRVILPDRSAQVHLVDANTPIIDMGLQLLSRYKLSPSAYKLELIDENGQRMPHLPSHLLKAYDVAAVELVCKQDMRTQSERSFNSKLPPSAPPFAATKRITIHLSNQQRSVFRVDPVVETLAVILERVCQERNIDPKRYELRPYPDRNGSSVASSDTPASLGATELVLVKRDVDGASLLHSASLHQLSSSQQLQSSSASMFNQRTMPARTAKSIASSPLASPPTDYHLAAGRSHTATASSSSIMPMYRSDGNLSQLTLENGGVGNGSGGVPKEKKKRRTLFSFFSRKKANQYQFTPQPLETHQQSSVTRRGLQDQTNRQTHTMVQAESPVSVGKQQRPLSWNGAGPDSKRPSQKKRPAPPPPVKMDTSSVPSSPPPEEETSPPGSRDTPSPNHTRQASASGIRMGVSSLDLRRRSSQLSIPAAIPTETTQGVATHSRQSSNSSGYHEGSTLSDSPPSAAANSEATSGGAKPIAGSGRASRSVKKRRAPPPPVPTTPLPPDEPAAEGRTNDSETEEEAVPPLPRPLLKKKSKPLASDTIRSTTSSTTMEDLERSFQQVIEAAEAEEKWKGTGSSGDENELDAAVLPPPMEFSEEAGPAALDETTLPPPVLDVDLETGEQPAAPGELSTPPPSLQSSPRVERHRDEAEEPPQPVEQHPLSESDGEAPMEHNYQVNHRTDDALIWGGTGSVRGLRGKVQMAVELQLNDPSPDDPDDLDSPPPPLPTSPPPTNDFDHVEEPVHHRRPDEEDEEEEEEEEESSEAETRFFTRTTENVASLGNCVEVQVTSMTVKLSQSKLSPPPSSSASLSSPPMSSSPPLSSPPMSSPALSSSLSSTSPPPPAPPQETTPASPFSVQLRPIPAQKPFYYSTNTTVVEREPEDAAPVSRSDTDADTDGEAGRRSISDPHDTQESVLEELRRRVRPVDLSGKAPAEQVQAEPITAEETLTIVERTLKEWEQQIARNEQIIQQHVLQQQAQRAKAEEQQAVTPPPPAPPVPPALPAEERPVPPPSLQPKPSPQPSQPPSPPKVAKQPPPPLKPKPIHYDPSRFNLARSPTEEMSPAVPASPRSAPPAPPTSAPPLPPSSLPSPKASTPTSAPPAVLPWKKTLVSPTKRNSMPPPASKDTRTELLDAIRGFGGRDSLKKVAANDGAWHSNRTIVEI